MMLKQLELKFIPPIVALTTLILMCLTAYFLPPAAFSLSTRLILLGACFAFGGTFAASGIVHFRRAKTTITPKPEQTTALVSSGIYRFTRNPMYLGLATVLCGFTATLGSVWLLIWVAFFVVYITQFQIKPEERILTTKFPIEYPAYQQRVRRWI